MQKGYVHLYYGDGKGKTTAAIGLAVRAAGAGLRVAVLQFLKTDHSSECCIFSSIPNITVINKKQQMKFLFQMNEAEKTALISQQNAELAEASALAFAGQVDLLVLDEAMTALNLNTLDPPLLQKLLAEKPDGLEIVITGHEMNPELEQYADYMTKMVKVKHPYDKGVPAREGIEQ